MKFLKKYRSYASLLGFLFLAAGCGFGGGGGGGGTKTTLNMWGLFETSANMAPFIAAYEQLHPTVQIIYTEKNVATYQQDLLNALAAGDGPDIFYIHNDWLPTYMNKMQPATAQEWGTTDYQNSFADVASNDFVSGSQVYAAPLTVDTLVLYYNKDILGSYGIALPPQTWNQLASDSQKISQQSSNGYFNKSGVALGTSSNINRSADIMYLLMLQAGTTPFSSDHSHATIDQSVSAPSGGNSLPGATALNFYTSFANSSSPNYDWNSSSDYSINAFANGGLAMMYGYYYDRASILQEAPNLNFGIAPVPQPNLNQNLVNYSNYWGYGVSKQSKNPNWDWDFIKSMTTQTALAAYYKRDPLPASRKDIIAEQVTDPNLGVVASSTLTSKSFYKPEADQSDSIITGMIDDVSLKDDTVTNALSNASQQLTALAAQQSQH